MRLAQRISRLRLRCRREVCRRVARRPCSFQLSRPIISFTFDDFPTSAAALGGSILREFHICATYYVSLGLAGTVAPTGRIVDLNRLEDVILEGHELGSHTFDHCHAWDTDARTFGESLDRNQEELEHLLPGVFFETMSYPISCPNPGVKRAAGSRFAVCRGGGQTFNVDELDRNYVKSFFLEKSRQRPKEVKEIIAQTCAAKGWLVLVTHDISDTPTAFGCSPVFFEDIVKCARKSEATILPVMQAWRSICPVRPLASAASILNQEANTNLR